jgi:hypothetical protein
MAKDEYFDITKLYPVLEKNGWTEGKNFMKFWADGPANVAKNDPREGKSTVGANVSTGLRIYELKWKWLTQFRYVVDKYNEFFKTRAKNKKLQDLLRNKYGKKAVHKVHEDINEWLTNDLSPRIYIGKIKQHQAQYIEVNSYELNQNRFDDMVAALNGFHFYAFYKGGVINSALDKQNISQCIDEPRPGESVPLRYKNDPLQLVPKSIRYEVYKYLQNPKIKNVIYISHIGMYAADIYEFNGSQYLATWNLKNNTVEISKWDYLWGTSDTDDEEDLAITNETYNIYRQKTNKGGDFLALSPIKLVEYPFTVPVY